MAIIRVNVNSAQETALVIIRGIAVMVSLQSTRRFSSSEANGGCYKHPISTEARYRRGATPRRSGGCRSSNPAHPVRQPRPADDGAVALDGAGVMRARLEVSIGACQRVSLPEVVVSPAGDGVVGYDGARVLPADVERPEGARWRVPLPEGVVPQQLTVSSVAIAQAWRAPVARVLKVPAGASLCPMALLPQQETVPSVERAHT